ncbi:hypothetical protein CYMTET_14913 [Cymbomonas tetramitiformis]|uniref:Uncharacterized protein n=1 Tax=Cymbomonas tetramitiformis TaxID=36881 RepID=A0AAE0GF38_9CHLO|nr:hypothetical protein CYMTET_14913 [Cymbomonas tetramitiformis]|eukprot:gene26309-32256_t
MVGSLPPSVNITLANNTIPKHTDLLPAVQAGRAAMHADFVRHWVTDLDESILEDYSCVRVALDPRWENSQFDGCNIFLAGSMTAERARSVGYLRTAWVD